MSERPFTIIDAINDENLFGAWFRDRNTWQAWFAFLAALFGLPMTPEQLAIYQRCTGRTAPRTEAASEAWLVIGRRGGKSFMLALIAVFLACFKEYRQYLAPGERGTILVIATDRRQARVIFRYIRGLLSNVPMLAKMVLSETTETIDLKNAVTIEVGTASFRSTRGHTLVAALCDELAFWRTEDAAEPDTEILAALRPGMATIPNAMMFCASSPYARKGELWKAHQRWFGKDDARPLVWQADTRTMNPTVPQSVIDDAIERDPSSAAAEFGAQFRRDIEAFVAREAVEACVEPGCIERAMIGRTRYFGFVDPSGGSSDSFTMAVSHKEGDVAVLDCLREIKPPFSPEAVVAEFAAVLISYGLHKVIGDRYAGEWPREQFLKHGIKYVASARPKSDLYKDTLAALNSRRCVLLDNPRLASQLISLERRTARGGRDSIDHPPGGHDDLANAACGALVEIVLPKPFVGLWDANKASPPPPKPRVEYVQQPDGTRRPTVINL